MKRILIITILIWTQGQLFAQDHVKISLADVLAKVQESNASIKVSEQEAKMAKYDYRFSNSIFLPQIAVSHTGMATTNPLMAFGSKLNQEILTQADFNPALLNDPDQIQNYATKVSVEQPLINLDGFYQRKAAKTTMEAKELQAMRTRDYLNFEAQKAYGQLQLAHRAVAVLQKAFEAANANLNMAQNSYDQGLLQKADLLEVKVRVTEVSDQLKTAKSHVKNASDYLAFLMNEQGDVVYQPSEELVPDNLGETVEVTLENRADVKAMDLVSEAYRANMKADNMTFLPRLNAFASYEMYDDQIFQADAKGYIIGASLSWDVFKGSQRFAKAGKSKTSYEKAKQEYEQYVAKSIMELQRTKRMVEDAESRLQTSKLAMEQSEESLRIRTNRFKEGLEKTTDLLMAEATYAEKQLAYYQTIFEYNQAQSLLTFLTKE
ncbi:MAG TPA: transporter [Muricauda sp.]|uniref:TolC family protein n=1 Tax=Flagellimonas aurea TaxID=2915619 RepID=A0ABS3G7T2_9FLAO|nr:TolC family protein [Allomuricauda aurea]MAO17408.1 transporter [Allomuricauda sp.]MBC71284.1 transporter [Allomuricauda sp.]MBO0355471.1 TolC family protein [Allomuricauda aurea]HBU77368.1 transporter [Allomuricauda sp.]|tara:strand:- start:572 stop:1876 length:1305 start_codon:yes stop_codon:yes gene_type:complete